MNYEQYNRPFFTSFTLHVILNLNRTYSKHWYVIHDILTHGRISQVLAGGNKMLCSAAWMMVCFFATMLQSPFDSTFCVSGAAFLT